MNILAIALGLASAAVFAFGSALEQHAAKQERPTRTLDPRLLFRLLHRPMWLFGWIPDAAATVLQAVALNVGALALIEPLLLGGVFMAIPLESALERRRPHRRDLLVVALGVVGLATFLVAANPRAGVDQPSPEAWTGVGVVVGALFMICLVIGWRLPGASRGVLLGIATGLLYGTAAALLKTLTAEFANDPVGVFDNWQLYALIVLGITGVVLNQNAFQAGPIAAPLSAIALVDPVAGVVIGMTAFHERLSAGGPRLGIEIVAILTMTVGMSLASTTRSR